MNELVTVPVDFNSIRRGNRIWGVPDETDKLTCGQKVWADDGDGLKAQAEVIAVRIGFTGREVVELLVDPDTYVDVDES